MILADLKFAGALVAILILTANEGLEENNTAIMATEQINEILNRSIISLPEVCFTSNHSF
jgi:hypothetical protein